MGTILLATDGGKLKAGSQIFPPLTISIAHKQYDHIFKDAAEHNHPQDEEHCDPWGNHLWC